MAGHAEPTGNGSTRSVFFRFRKTEPLMDSHLTSVTEHEENWWGIVGLAYALLSAASGIAEKSSFPWERYPPYFKRDTQ
ncbi:hypothetical protein QUF90_17705 [Desulfococcaceae bacterium HSG9]|nr:hypothetical protein [Desulfococcaceae bacterium HSG9]